MLHLQKCKYSSVILFFFPPSSSSSLEVSVTQHSGEAQRHSQGLWRRGGIWTRTLLKSVLTLIITLYAGSSPGTSLLALCLLVYLVAREKGKKHERTHNNPLIQACPITKTIAFEFFVLVFQFEFFSPFGATWKLCGGCVNLFSSSLCPFHLAQYDARSRNIQKPHIKQKINRNRKGLNLRTRFPSFVFASVLKRVQFLLFNGLCTIQNGYKSRYLQATCEQSWIQYTKTPSATAQEPLINNRPRDISQSSLNGRA